MSNAPKYPPPGQAGGVPIEGTDLPPMNGVTRPILHQILTDKAIEEGVEVRYNTTFDDLVENDDSVTVHFADGSTEDFDLVVGADGVRSSVRRHVLDAVLSPRVRAAVDGYGYRLGTYRDLAATKH